MPGQAQATLAVDELVRELERFTYDEFSGAVTEVLRSHLVDRASLEPYAFFSPRHYTRNLIYKNDVFEMLALCWSPGQQSSIHNHRDQQCWMLMGEGVLENHNFRVLDRDEVKKTCRLEASSMMLIDRESPLAVDPAEPVHLVRCAEARGTRALSIHIYSRPFDTCEIYCPDRGIYMDLKLTYWSQYGKVCQA